jgi:hypothetical protein
MKIDVIHNDLVDRIIYTARKSPAPARDELHMYFREITEVIGFYQRYFFIDLSGVFKFIIAEQHNTADQLAMTALELRLSGQTAAAVTVLDRAGTIDPSAAYIRVLAAELVREQGHVPEAKKRYATLLQECPHLLDSESCSTMYDVDKLLCCPYDYYQILDLAHRLLKPRRYIEIGVSTGKSLALTREGTNAIGIDPNAANSANQFFHSPECDPQLFAMTSNDFFKNYTLQPLFGSATFDMAFIDGLHVFEQALMDFIHLEALSAPGSVIFIHDCLPVNPLTAERVRQTGFWTGDVWRVIACLKALRPDLGIVTFPTSPSGLAMITGLDSTSRILAQQFDTIVAHFITMPLPESFPERSELLNVTNSDPAELIATLPPLPSASH